MIKSLDAQYFPGGNTAWGFYSLWDSNLNDLQRLIILKGGPGTGKSTLLSGIAREFTQKGVPAELLWCSSDAESLDGIIFRKIGVGIVDGTAPHVREPRYPGVIDKIINLGDYWNEALLLENKKDIIYYTDANRDLFRQTYETMAEAKKYLDELKQLTQEGMAWDAVDEMTEKLLREIFSEYPDQSGGHEYHRFAGASTPQGSIYFLDEIMRRATVTYVVKGGAGTGKSTLAKKIAQLAKTKGFAVEYYHCSFDPVSLDGILIPALGVCIINASPLHKKTPAAATNWVIEMFQYMSPEIFKKNLPRITRAEENFQATFAKALLILKECKSIHDQLEDYYRKAMNFSDVALVKEKILQEIQRYLI